MSWEKVMLGEISKVISGYPFKSKDFQPTGTPVIKIKNIKDENIVLQESDCVDSSIVVPDRFHLGQGDILISLTGSHITLPSSVVGRVARYRHDTVSYLNQRAGKFININEARCDKSYLYYFLLQKETTTRIALKAQGAANQANISPGDVEGVRIPLPPLPAQRRIASILSAYDDLIENNLKRIKLLEEKAFLRYKEIVRGEKLEERKLGEVLDLKYGKALKSDDRIEGVNPVYGSSGIVGHHNDFLVKGPSIVVGRKGNVGSVFWAFDNFWPIDTSYYVESVISLYYLYFDLQGQNFVNTDAAVPGLNRKFALDNPIGIPNDIILEDFDKIVKPVFQLIHNLQKQNAKLREARDILLPRLMSGELAV